MTELMKRYEAETGEKAKKKVLVMYSTKRYGWGREKNHLFFTNKFVKWFKDKYDTLEAQLIDHRNKCDEISELKAKLTWIPIADRLPLDTQKEQVLVKYRELSVGVMEAQSVKLCRHIATHWFPIPPAPEGDKQ